MTDTDAPAPTLPTSAPPASLLTDFFRQHPGLILTLSYLLLTAVGITYDVLFYGLFGIPVLYFSEPSDFVLAGFRHPVIFLLFLLSVITLRRLVRRDRRWRERSSGYARLAQRMERMPVFSNWVLYPLTTAAYFAATTAMYAQYNFKRIVTAGGDAPQAVIVETNAARTPSACVLLGANSKFLFLYEPERRTTRIVPIASVARLTLGRSAPAPAVPAAKP